MSHFLFGVIEVPHEPNRETLGQSLQVSWGPALQQAGVIEMLADHGKPTSSETIFSLSLPCEDNADTLVSPYQVDNSKIVENLCLALEWLEQMRGRKGAELWLTEGYDDVFKQCHGSCQELQQLIRSLSPDLEALPSLRLILQ